MTDLTINIDNDKKLTCRVCFLAVRDNKMLCMKGKHFSYLPGGRIKFDEPSNEAVIREAEEELHIKIKSPVFCGLLENFFFEKCEQYTGHELCFFYRIDLADDFVPPEFEKYGRRNEWAWISIDEWNNRCLPVLPREDLENIYFGKTFFHIVNRDKKD